MGRGAAPPPPPFNLGAAPEGSTAVTSAGIPMVAVWSARVERSGVSTVAEGTNCEVSANVGVSDVPFMQRVRVTCGGKTLYETGPNPAARRALTQHFGKTPGTIDFEGAYDDNTLVPPRLRMGTTSAVRPHADAADMTARLDLGVGPDDSIDLRVSRTSTAWTSKPLGTYAAAAFDRPARVLTASGKRMAAPGTVCRMQVMPLATDECDVTVDCRPAAKFWDRFPHVLCNAGASAAGAQLTLEDSMGREVTQPVLHFDTVDRPFTLTARVPDTFLLELTLQPKLD